MSLKDYMHSVRYSHPTYVFPGADVSLIISVCVRNQVDLESALADAASSAVVDFQAFSFPRGFSHIHALMGWYVDLDEPPTLKDFEAAILKVGGEYLGVTDGNTLVEVPDHVDI